MTKKTQMYLGVEFLGKKRVAYIILYKKASAKELKNGYTEFIAVQDFCISEWKMFNLPIPKLTQVPDSKYSEPVPISISIKFLKEKKSNARGKRTGRGIKYFPGEFKAKNSS